MDAIQAGYNMLVAAVFEDAYRELVENIQKARREEDRKRTAPTLQMKEENSVEYRRAVSRIVYIEGWIRRAAPQWIEIDPENIIKWAHEEAGDEA